VGALIIATIIILGLGLFARSVSGTDYTSTSRQSFTVSGVPTVVIDSSAGSITVRQGATNQVQVQANRIVRTDNASTGENALDQIPVEMRQNGDTINITSRFDSTVFGDASLARRVDYVVTVPASANLNFRLSAGNVTVTGITGTVLTTVSAGNVEISDATLSGASSFSVNAGTITFDGTLRAGSSLHTKVGTGNTNLTLPQALPAHVEADTNVGNISINGWPISVSREKAVNSHASGDLNTPTTVNIMSQVSVGNITLTAK
jgi:phage baseplate assembly protein gpV